MFEIKVELEQDNQQLGEVVVVADAKKNLPTFMRIAPQTDVPRPVVGRGERVELRAEQLFHPQHKSFRQQGPHPQFKMFLLYRISVQKESPQSFQLHLHSRL